MACAASRNGSTYQKLNSLLTQLAALIVNGNDDNAHTPTNRARSNHRFCIVVRNNALPARIKLILQAAAPTGLARSAAANANEPMPIIQYGRPVSSSGVRIHIHAP